MPHKQRLPMQYDPLMYTGCTSLLILLRKARASEQPTRPEESLRQC